MQIPVQQQTTQELKRLLRTQPVVIATDKTSYTRLMQTQREMNLLGLHVRATIVRQYDLNAA